MASWKTGDECVTIDTGGYGIHTANECGPRTEPVFPLKELQIAVFGYPKIGSIPSRYTIGIASHNLYIFGRSGLRLSGVPIREVEYYRAHRWVNRSAEEVVQRYIARHTGDPYPTCR